MQAHVDITADVNEKARSKQLLQYGLSTQDDLIKNIKLLVEMKVRLDNQY